METDPGGDAPARDYSSEAKAILKAEMKRRGASYADLVALLAIQGVKESEANLRNKVSRGNFSASFFLQVLDVLGTTFLHLDSSKVTVMSGRRRFSGKLGRGQTEATEGADADRPGSATSEPPEPANG